MDLLSTYFEIHAMALIAGYCFGGLPGLGIAAVLLIIWSIVSKVAG